MTIEEAVRRHGPGIPVNEAVPVTSWSGAQLLRQYQSTSGEPGDKFADRLLAEIERRELDI